jgi:hypothetical protein
MIAQYAGTPLAFRLVGWQNNKECKYKMKSILILTALSVLSLASCKNIPGDVNTVIIYETSVQKGETTLDNMARDAIILLPADKQDAAKADLTKAEGIFDASFNLKNTTLQAIEAGASSDWVTLGTLITQEAIALESLANLIKTFGNSAIKDEKLKASYTDTVTKIVADLKAMEALTVSRIPAK